MFGKNGVYEYLKQKKNKMHMTLIDPDEQDVETSMEISKKSFEYGTDAIMIGGSWGDIYNDKLEQTILKIKEATNNCLPIILFPNSAQGLSKNADAVFFMSLFNSRLPQYIINEPAKGALIIKKYGIETLPMAYLVIRSNSSAVGNWVADVKPIPENKPELTVSYSLTAKYFGMKMVYLETGSGAMSTVQNNMISETKKMIGDDMFLIVGGGIRDGKTAKEKIDAGADIIVTGTIAEKNCDKLEEIIRMIKQ